MQLFSAAAAMGFGPHQVDQWEPWQYRAAYDGWVASKVPPQARAPSDADFEAAVARSVH